MSILFPGEIRQVVAKRFDELTFANQLVAKLTVLFVEGITLWFTEQLRNHSRTVTLDLLAQNVGSGAGPKNNRSIFSLPITRASSRTVQYIRISKNRMISTAQ